MQSRQELDRKNSTFFVTILTALRDIFAAPDDALILTAKLKKDIHKILVIRLSSIGDILLTSPLLRVLKKRFPEATIDFVTKTQFGDLLSTNPALQSIYTLDTRGKHAALKNLRNQLAQNGYNLVVDAHNNFRSFYLRKIPGAHIVRVKKYKLARFFFVTFGWNFYKQIIPVYKRYIDTVAPLGVVDDELGLEFFPQDSVQAEVDLQLARRGFKETTFTIAIAPGASYATKRWPVERFDRIAKKLQETGAIQFLLLGDKNDTALTTMLKKELGEAAIDCAGQLSLMQSACALNRADLLLTNDTGLMHLGTALKKPVVAIFGSTVRELGFYPFGEQSIVIENERLRCRPCSHVGKTSCPKKHFKCMLDISPDAVLARLLPLIEQRSRT